jgi:hypothetical protein
MAVGTRRTAGGLDIAVRPMTSLRAAAALGRAEQGLAIVSTLRTDNTIQSTLVNAGVLDHPVTGRPAVAFVTAGRVKRAHLRARPQITVSFRSGWQWASIKATPS